MCQCHFNSIEIRIRMCFMIKHWKDFMSVGTLGIKALLFLLPSHLSAYQWWATVHIDSLSNHGNSPKASHISFILWYLGCLQEAANETEPDPFNELFSPPLTFRVPLSYIGVPILNSIPLYHQTYFYFKLCAIELFSVRGCSKLHMLF